jgi:D-hydroxyproline dehydrogenase subunit gamma
MFRLRSESGMATIAVMVEGTVVHVPAGASAAAAVLAAGFRSIRETPVMGAPRGPYCMMGICYECLAEIDGAPNRQSCMIEVRPGMQIRRQIRAPRIDPSRPSP